ncbi:MAG TPA: FUN14 domain-containing protein [Tepidisphaeraceae bacterium]|jgi:uncharacterized membrane protein (Fun14 family)|nr:FUN14 domain-containing protein [Tepidisphaeraceae bacterium]
MTDEGSVQRHKLSHAVAELPSWKKRLLALAMMAALIGGGAQLATMFTATQRSVTETPPPARVEASERMPDGASGFLNGQPSSGSRTEVVHTVDIDEVELSHTERIAGWMFRVGLAVFVGVIVGTVFRMFIKTMAALAAIIVTAIVVLSYFKVINVDFTTMKDNYDSVAGWAQSQAVKLKDLVLAALPSTTSAAIGFFLGFKR